MAKVAKSRTRFIRLFGLPPHKLKKSVKTRFVNKVMFFQMILEFVNAINICYFR
jgi:hypothetical protein